MKTEQIRIRTIHLPDKISEEEIQTVSKIFAESESVISFKFDKNRLIIEYVFPTMRFSDISTVIAQIISTNKIGVIQKLWCSLMVYMEDNEYDHIIIINGWQKYIQDIYVSHFILHTHQEVQNQESRHNQHKQKLWQRHLEPVNQQNQKKTGL